VSKPKTEVPLFEKEVVRLPDGRELTYYRFPDVPASSEAAGGGRASPGQAAGSGSPTEKER
jgi:hypothetical protein